MSTASQSSPPGSGLVVIERIDPQAPGLRRAGKAVSTTVALICFLFVGLLVVLAAFLADLDPHVVKFGLIAYAVIAGPIFLAGALSNVRAQVDSYSREVSYRDGELTLTTPNASEQHRIEECCWFLGRARDDPTLEYQLLRGRSVVIVLPSGRNVVCGLSPEKRRQWRSLLESVGCRRVLRQEGWFGFLVFLLMVCGLAAGGFVGWHAGRFVRDLVAGVLGNNNVLNLIPAAGAILLSWICGVCPQFFVPGWRRGTEEERAKLYRSAVLFPAKIAIPVGVFLGGNIANGVILAITFAIIFLLIARFLTRKQKRTATG